jgi:hypothetical protein
MEKIRKLATIRRISDIQPIPGADKIEVATVDGWKVVVAKDVGHKVGNLVVYCEIDSFLPVREEYEFLRKSSYKKMADDSEGFRLRTVKLRNQISQGLILPMSVFEGYGYRISENLLNESPALEPNRSVISPADMIPLVPGQDVTQILGIVKYDPPIPAELAGMAKGGFPSFIPKTDEERIQNLASEYEEMKKESDYYATEKLDGTSSTFYINNGEFGICSRNWELLETEGNTFWRVARELDLENKMRNCGMNLAIQGETIGESIQGNPYKIKGQTVKFFSAFDIDKQEYLPFPVFRTIIENVLGLETVPVVTMRFELPENIEDLITLADDKSKLNPLTDREGLVIRSWNLKRSFKVISNNFLLDEK